MDTIPDREFLEIFNRVCDWVRYGRVRNPEEARARMRRVLRIMRRAVKTSKKRSTKIKWRAHHNRMRTLYRKGFNECLWNEAINAPNSIYGLTLAYGREKALRILKLRVAKRLGPMVRIERVGRRARLRFKRYLPAKRSPKGKGMRWMP